MTEAMIEATVSLAEMVVRVAEKLAAQPSVAAPAKPVKRDEFSSKLQQRCDPTVKKAKQKVEHKTSATNRKKEQSEAALERTLDAHTRVYEANKDGLFNHLEAAKESVRFKAQQARTLAGAIKKLGDFDFMNDPHNGSGKGLVEAAKGVLATIAQFETHLVSELDGILMQAKGDADDFRAAVEAWEVAFKHREVDEIQKLSVVLEMLANRAEEIVTSQAIKAHVQHLAKKGMVQKVIDRAFLLLEAAQSIAGEFAPPGFRALAQLVKGLTSFAHMGATAANEAVQEHQYSEEHVATEIFDELEPLEMAEMLAGKYKRDLAIALIGISPMMAEVIPVPGVWPFVRNAIENIVDAAFEEQIKRAKETLTGKPRDAQKEALKSVLGSVKDKLKEAVADPVEFVTSVINTEKRTEMLLEFLRDTAAKRFFEKIVNKLPISAAQVVTGIDLHDAVADLAAAFKINLPIQKDSDTWPAEIPQLPDIALFDFIDTYLEYVVLSERQEDDLGVFVLAGNKTPQGSTLFGNLYLTGPKKGKVVEPVGRIDDGALGALRDITCDSTGLAIDQILPLREGETSYRVRIGDLEGRLDKETKVFTPETLSPQVYPRGYNPWANRSVNLQGYKERGAQDAAVKGHWYCADIAGEGSSFYLLITEKGDREYARLADLAGGMSGHKHTIHELLAKRATRTADLEVLTGATRSG